MSRVLIVGAGFVCDLYMRSLTQYQGVEVVGVWDLDPERLKASTMHWGTPAARSLADLFERGRPGDLVLNLTNPRSHYEVSRACLDAGFNVYSEKPLALDMEEARDLVALAAEEGLMVTSAPCSALGEAAQTIWAAIRAGTIGDVRLVYAEMDEGYLSQAPFRKWRSDSGAPWPYRDEFETGCTLEHAGYCLSWLMQMFGPVRTVVAASAVLAPDDTITIDFAPDYSTGSLFFENGVVARLTCSAVATHDHSMKFIGERGNIELGESWNNAEPVVVRRRRTIRRRLIEDPFTRRLRLPQPTHAKLGRKGSTSLNYALGPVETLEAIAEGRRSRMPTDLALHMNEVTLALQNAGETGGAVRMTTRFEPIEPMPWARELA